jgi:hypothetical protein
LLFYGDFSVVLLEFGQAAVLVVGDVLEFLAELLLHVVPEFDLLLVLDEGEGHSFELVLGHYLHLGDLAGEQFGGLVPAHQMANVALEQVLTISSLTNDFLVSTISFSRSLLISTSLQVFSWMPSRVSTRF